MEDVSDATSLATSTPEEAAQNISNANLFSVDPRYAAENKSIFTGKAKELEKPQSAEPPVADYARQSSEHAALISPDMDHLSWSARQLKMIGDYVFERPTTERQIVDLNLKKMEQGGNLNSDDEISLMSANQDAKDQSDRNYGLNGPLDKIPAVIAGGLTDLGTSIVRGARKGILEGPFSNLRHPLTGVSMNATYGALIKDPFDTLTAGTYNELSNLTDEQGQPKNLDHDTKAAISRGVGVVGTALMNTAGFAVAEASPWLSKFVTPSLAKTLMMDPGKVAVIASLGNAMKGAAAVGGASGLTEVAKIIGEEMAQHYGTDEAGFWNALTIASQKLGEYAPRVGTAAGQGALLGLALETPLQIAGFNSLKTYVKNTQERARFHAYQNRGVYEDFRAETARDVGGGTGVPNDESLKLTGASGEIPTNDVTPNEGDGEPPIQKAFKALQLNEALHQVNDVQRDTNVSEIAPNELDEVNKRSLFAAGFNRFYATFTGLRDWANTEEKGKAARQLIDPSGVAAGQMNAPFELHPHKVMEIAREYPDILDHVQFNPDAPTGMQAKDYIEALNRAEEQRQEVMQKLGIKPEEIKPPSNVTELPERPKAAPLDIQANYSQAEKLLNDKKELLVEPDKNKAKIAKIDEKLNALKEETTKQLGMNPPGSVLSFPYNEADAAKKAELAYGRQPTFTEALRSVLPEEQVSKFDEAVLRSRLHVTDLVHDQAVHEMNAVVDQTAALAKEDQRRAELDRIAHDPNFALVDRFHQYQVANAKGKNKRSFYAIDPITLPDDMLHYTDNPQLKAHKVFVKGASSVEDSARALGYQNGKDLLDVLARTPTREAIIKARSDFYNSHIEEMAKAGVDLDNTNIMKSFTERTKANLEGMRFLKDNDWSAAKFGAKKIALPLPKIEEIEYDSREAIKKMTAGSLNPSQWIVGERQSYKMAVDKFFNGDLAGSFQAKEMTARNISMQRAVRMATAEINRIQKFARRLEEPTAKQVMQDAGKLSQNALDEILDVFNFNPKRKNQAELNQYQKWTRRELEQGRGDFTIPERLSDVRKSLNDMTVEQILAAGDKMKAVFKEAQYKAELIENKNLREEERNIDRIVDQVEKALKDHPGNSDKNIPPVQETTDFFQGMRMFIQDKEMAFANMEHTLRYFDQGKLNGLFQELFMHQLKGDGKFDKKSGYSKENLMIQRFAEQTRKIMDNHGDFEKLEKKILAIPEFADIRGLNGGRLTKGDLMVLWAYKGDPEGRQKLQNNFKDSSGKGLSIQTWQKVFDKHLEKRDVTAMQYFVDMFKGYQEETRDLQQRDKGEDVVFVKGVPNEHQGVFYPGGYVHLHYRHEFTDAAAKRTIDFLEGKKAAWFEKGDGEDFGRQFAAEQTEQGRLIKRTNSDLPLDASLLRFLRGHEEVIHDLSYREAVKNDLKLARDKRIKEAMIRAGGIARYNLIVNTVIEMAGRAEAQNANYFSDQNRFLKNLFGHLQNNFNVTVLGLNVTSTAIQYESLTQLLQNIGVKGQKHFAIVNSKMFSHPHLWAGFYDFANDLDPTIGHFLEGLQNKVTSVVHDLVPSKSRVPGLSPFKATHKFMVSKMMAPMALADIHLKVMGAVTSYSQFMAGDAEGWPLEKVMALSEKERHEQAQAYARQVSRLSLTHARPEDKAPFQKFPLTQFFANYWNDLRNVLNNEINQGRKTKYAMTKGIEAGKQGNTKESLGYFGTAAGIVMATMVFATLGRWYSDKLRGIQQTPDQWPLDLRSKEGLKDAAEKMGYYSLMSPADQMFSVEPIVRETFFAANMPDKIIRGYVDKTKTVQLPITKELSDVATAGNSLADVVQSANSLSEFLFFLRNLDNKETKAILNAESYLGIPMPVNAYSKLMRFLERPLNSPEQILPAALEKLHKTVAEFNANPPQHLDLQPKFVAQLKDVEKQVAPMAVQVPPAMPDILKYAMSGADWSKPNGIFGFSRDQWSDIQKSAPELGLTSIGRISKNTEQQEKAATWLLHDDAQKLAVREVPVREDTLFGAFRLGIRPYEALYKAPNDSKTKTVLGQEILDKNPDLANLKTVGQVKSFLLNQLDKAARAREHKLTLSSTNTED